MVTPTRTVLLTGFDAFGGEASNPSGEVAQRLDGRRIAGHRVVGRVLPTAFGTSRDRLAEWLDELKPALVVATGLATTRHAISLERVALNLDDARMPDNRGARPIDRPIEPDGPAAYFATLPVPAILLALLEAGLPAEVSASAGGFVCNHVFYGLMHATAGSGVRAGFIHLPPVAALSPDAMARGLALAVRVGLTATHDAHPAPGGVIA